MRLNLTIHKTVLILIGLVVISDLTFFFLIDSAIKDARSQSDKERHGREVTACLDDISLRVQKAAVGTVTLADPAYEYHAQDPFADLYKEQFVEIPKDLAKLKELVKADPQRIVDEINEVESTVLSALDLMEECRRNCHVQGVEGGQRNLQYKLMLSEKSREYTGQSHQLLEYFTHEQESTIAAERESQMRVNAFLMGGLAANLVTAVILALWFTRRITARLNTLTDNSMKLAMGQPIGPVLPGEDEIAIVDKAFHNMASAVEEAARKERALIDHAVDLICSISANDQFIAVNPAAMNVLGYDPADLLGKRYIDIVSAEAKEKTRQALKRVVTQPETEPLETQLVRQDGSQIDVLWSTHWSKEEQSFFCVIHDITVRKQAEQLLKASEERVRSIIDNLPVGVLVIDQRGTVQSVNPRTEGIFLCGAEQLIGREAEQLFRASNGKSTSLLELARTTPQDSVVEVDSRRYTGEPFPAEISFNTFRSNDQDLTLINVQDITQRREVERLKQEFVSMVSHDLRTPLTSIKGTLTLINVGAIDMATPFGKERVAAAERNLERLIKLVNDLLDLEKMEDGKLALQLDFVNVHDVVTRSIESVRVFGEQKQIEMRPALQPAEILGDEDRLVQVLVNLLSNAIKFSPNGSRVTVTTKINASFCVFAVADSGPGIPPEQRAVLFQRFQQLEVTRSQHKSGSGLGLSISKAIVEGHNGTIGVESEPGKGSTFWFQIPLAPAE
jgi:PAS domain S-box-containing protein